MAVVAAPLLLTGCSKDFLEVTPPDRATLQEYFSTRSHVTEAMVSTYNPMREYDWNNTQYAPLTLCSDVMADDVWPGGSGPSDNQHLQKMFNFNDTENSSDALTGIWDQSYKGVRNANDVLTYVSWNAETLGAAADSLNAEARVLRAFYYNQLWKFYGNIPFYLENLPAPYIGEQKGHDDVYAAVIADLEDVIAMKKLPMKWDDDNIGRVSQATAMMLYAEMVMYQNDESRYSKALGYMQEIIQSGDYALVADYSGIFLESGEWSSESIFEICYKDDQAIRGWNYPNINFAGGTIYPRLIGPSGGVADDGVDNGWGFEPVRLEAYTMFQDGDARRDATIYDARKASYTKRQHDTGLWLKKYLPYKENNKDQIADGDLNFNNNLRIYRYAETLLNAAELLVRTGGSEAQAQQYLNLVHHRSGLTDNRAATIDNIIDERHLEFVGEGKRYWDLVRTDKAATTLVPDAYGYRTNTWSASKKYLPIPLSEIDASQGTLTQNNY